MPLFGGTFGAGLRVTIRSCFFGTVSLGTYLTLCEVKDEKRKSFMGTLIDTHAHLTWPTLINEVPEIMERARAAEVKAVIDLGTDLETSRKAWKHAQKYSEIWFAAGVHPNDIDNVERNALDEIEELLHDPKCVAVGEIGLDYCRDYVDPHVQEEWFERQLEMAKRVGKPVAIHDREASADLMRMLDKTGYDGVDGPGGVFHCFAGDVAMAKELIERGFFLSFTGNITFKKSNRPAIIEEVPLERIMVETDAPFMAPVPKRGRPNEPAYIPYIAAKIAEIKSISIDDVAKATTENAIRCFGLTVE